MQACASLQVWLWCYQWPFQVVYLHPETKEKGEEINKQISNKMDLKKSKGIIC